MGLFLLGIPVAIIGGAMLCKDIKYTNMDNNIKNAKPTLNQQYEQIDEKFAEILTLCGAECKISKKGTNYNISSIKKGQYGTMEKFLALKGYNKNAIDYCKQKFDTLAEQEHQIQIEERNYRINKFENALECSTTNLYTVTSNYFYYMPQFLVEKKVKKMTEYLNQHQQSNVYCNIIMGGTEPHHNHTEVWSNIKTGKNQEAEEYIKDVSDMIMEMIK